MRLKLNHLRLPDKQIQWLKNDSPRELVPSPILVENALKGKFKIRFYKKWKSIVFPNFKPLELEILGIKDFCASEYNRSCEKYFMWT